MPEHDRFVPFCTELPELSSACGADTTTYDGSGVAVCWRSEAGRPCSAPLADIVELPHTLPRTVVLADIYPTANQRGIEEAGGMIA